jgi:AraC family transcriptional regulator
MGTALHLLASGPGWSVCDIVCGAGPHDRPFEERHEDICIATVTQGTFQYRSQQGSAVLAPGALLLGNAGACFECGHEHGTGDRCLAFHFTVEHLETVAAAVPEARRTAFSLPHLPPLPALMPLIAEAEAARDDGDGAALEELSLRLAGATAALLAGGNGALQRPSRRDERRITAALRRIEAKAHDQPHAVLSLADLAREAATSPYHFLRIFRQLVGMTPHQYVLRTRLHRAAVRLRRSDETISAIAFDTGFNDLSTFNRRFRRLMGSSPGAYRGQGRHGAP